MPAETRTQDGLGFSGEPCGCQRRPSDTVLDERPWFQFRSSRMRRWCRSHRAEAAFIACRPRHRVLAVSELLAQPTAPGRTLGRRSATTRGSSCSGDGPGDQQVRWWCRPGRSSARMWRQALSAWALFDPPWFSPVGQRAIARYILVISRWSSTTSSGFIVLVRTCRRWSEGAVRVQPAADERSLMASEAPQRVLIDRRSSARPQPIKLSLSFRVITIQCVTSRGASLRKAHRLVSHLALAPRPRRSEFRLGGMLVQTVDDGAGTGPPGWCEGFAPGPSADLDRPRAGEARSHHQFAGSPYAS